MTTVVHGGFEWDATKAAGNLAKHGVSFVEATTVFDDPNAVVAGDRTTPDRTVTVGLSTTARVLCVVTTERGERTRIISARKATTHEHRIYCGDIDDP